MASDPNLLRRVFLPKLSIAEQELVFMRDLLDHPKQRISESKELLMLFNSALRELVALRAELEREIEG